MRRGCPENLDLSILIPLFLKVIPEGALTGPRGRNRSRSGGRGVRSARPPAPLRFLSKFVSRKNGETVIGKNMYPFPWMERMEGWNRLEDEKIKAGIISEGQKRTEQEPRLKREAEKPRLSAE